MESSAPSHGDRFAYICIKGPWLSFNPNDSFRHTSDYISKYAAMLLLSCLQRPCGKNALDFKGVGVDSPLVLS